MTDSQGPVRIVDAQGIHPRRLDQAVLEQKLWSEGRLNPHINEMIFVFGSNEGGHHGAGAARFARQYRGAKMGDFYGPTGTCFAIPTKDETIRRTLPMWKIRQYVQSFLAFARQTPDTEYQVTCIGCGLAGLKHHQIAPMFFLAPENCFFDTQWLKELPDTAKFWGTV
jgi:hypothetical protein